MNRFSTCRHALLAIIAASSAIVGAPCSASADALESAWTEGFKNKVRLLAGRAERPGQNGERIYAAIEIVMQTGWKTYWRAPGDAGGIPPEFDLSASENATDVTVLYPAPHRLIDKSGTTIGYKDHIIFPIAVSPVDASKPVELKLKAAYGVCEKLCVPAEAELELTIPPDVGASPEIAESLSMVPRATAIQGSDPTVAKWRVEPRDKKMFLIVETDDPGIAGATDIATDAFVDSPKGTYLPVPKKLSHSGTQSAFEVDLTDGATLQELVGLPVRITLVGHKGHSETAITLP